MEHHSVIVPTILVETVQNYKAAIKLISEFTNRVQIDITDGQFADSKTIKLDQATWPKDWTADIHLMVKQPSLYMDMIMKLHPHMVILHAEADEDILPLFTALKAAGIKAGVALLRPTVPENVTDLINAADHVMIFAGTLGKMGGTASLIQTEKIRLIKRINNKVEIGWDGGANIDNIFSISRAGADVINVGSALAYANDPKTVYESMLDQIDKSDVI